MFGTGVVVAHLVETMAEVSTEGRGDGVLPGDRRAETVEELRRRIAAVPGSGVPSAGRAAPGTGTRRGAGGAVPVSAPIAAVVPAPAPSVGPVPTSGVASVVSPGVGIPLPRELRPLLPHGVVEPGRVVALEGGHGAVVALVAAATAAGRRCAVVGYPALGLAAVAAEGGDLSRVALVPSAGADPGLVASVLLDGMDMVVLDPECGRIPPARARVLAGRARSAGTVLLVGAAEWHGADLYLGVGPARCLGLDRGYGRIVSLSSPVRARGRSCGGGPRRGELALHGTPSRSVAGVGGRTPGACGASRGSRGSESPAAVQAGRRAG